MLQADNSTGFSYVLPVEVTVVGLTYGIKPEVVYTPFEQAKWLEAKASVGLMPGPSIFPRLLPCGFVDVISISPCTYRLELPSPRISCGFLTHQL